MTRAVAGAAAVACLGCAVALHAAQERWPAPAVDAPGLMYLRSPAVVKRVVLDYDAIAADLYWIRALQHFGEERHGSMLTPAEPASAVTPVVSVACQENFS